jgi:hypothetical protein
MMTDSEHALARQEAGRSAGLKKALTALTLSNERNKKLTDAEAQRVAQRSSAAVGVESAAAPVCANSVNVGWSTSGSATTSHHVTRHGTTAVSQSRSSLVKHTAAHGGSRTSATSILNHPATPPRCMACYLSCEEKKERALDRLEYMYMYTSVSKYVYICTHTHTHTHTHRCWLRKFLQCNDICEAIERRLLQVSCARARARARTHTTHNTHSHKYKTHTQTFFLFFEAIECLLLEICICSVRAHGTMASGNALECNSLCHTESCCQRLKD